MQDNTLFYSPQYESIMLNEDGKLQSWSTHSTSLRRNNSSSSKQSFAGCSTMSSMASDASSCARISPPTSFHKGLRRSTFDLSDYDSLNDTYSNDCTLRKRSCATNGAATQALLELASSSKDRSSSRQSLPSSTSSSSWNESETVTMYSSSTAAEPLTKEEHTGVGGLESIIEDVFLGYMSILFLVINMERQVRSLFREIHCIVGYVWETIRANAFQFEEPLERSRASRSSGLFPANDSIPRSLSALDQMVLNQQQRATTSEEQRDDLSSSNQELLTPMKLADTSSHSSKDEWGHFADFQDELADEASFIPSCCRLPPPRSSLRKSSTSGLAPLAEVDGDDNEEEEDWTF